MPDRAVRRKRQTYAKLIAMGLIWSGFVFFLEHLATQDGQELDYSRQGLLFLFVWGAKIGGLLVAVCFAVLLAMSFKRP